MKYLFTTSDAFDIPRRGCVLVPGIPEDAPTVRVGALITLRLPSGASVETEIIGIELLNYGARTIPRKIFAPILLPKKFKAQDIPVGTEVYLREAHQNEK